MYTLLSFFVILFGISNGSYIKESNVNNLDVKDEIIDYYLPDDVQVKKYDIQLSVYLNEDNPKNFSFDGDVKIKFQLKNQVESLILHSENLTITSLTLTRNSHEIESLNVDIDAETNFLSIYNHEKKPLKPGNYNLKVQYSGKLAEEAEGFYGSSYINAKNETK